MKKKYILSLIVIGILFALTLTIGTGYGLYLSTSVKNERNATTLDCFKAYFSHSDIIELKNINPVVNDEGKETSPYTLTITNICEETKELQIRLNVLSETTFDTTALTIETAGNIEQDTILYKNLPNAKTKDKNVKISKLIGKITIKPNETIRTNIKLWFDEKKSPELNKEDIFKAQFELIDTASTIKASFSEVLLNNTKVVTDSIDYSTSSYTTEGLYQIKSEDGNSYYYRGIVNNNYIKFGNYIWRIVGINPDNSIKIILEKSAISMNYSDKTNAIDYTGLKYIYNDEVINNNVNDFLEQWYKTNIIDRDLDKYVVASSFCNDSSNFVNSYHTYFNGYTRLITDKRPTITCPTTNADFGGIYKQKIGLITADEVAIAGGVYNTNNYNYYLYNGETFFTITGADYYNYTANLFIVTNTGAISTAPTTNTYGIRPVINISSTTTVSGAGTIDNPYTIDIDE
ncbi:MAG: hypothetical protein ACI4XM_00505 [Candidatus Coprovivens sp.]